MYLAKLLRRRPSRPRVYFQPCREANKEATVPAKYDLYRLETGPSTSVKLKEEDALYMLRTMMYIRRMENKSAELYRLRLINGFLHLYSGQEAVAVGARMSMTDKDHLITAYRCHGFTVVFGVTAREIFAELMGRKTGITKGKGGSMHMYAKQFYGGEGIVGGQVSVGAGLALAQKYHSSGGVAFAFYGDGAANQGQVAEAFNMAKLWNLPVVFVCENNVYAMGTAVHRHAANTNFYTRGDLIPGVRVDGMRVQDVREAIKFARNHALKDGPIILEMVTYRYFGHSMSDPGTSYRTRDEIRTVQTQRDPIELLAKLMIEQGMKTDAEIKEIRAATFKAVDEEMELAKADPVLEIAQISEYLYVKPLEKVRGKIAWEMF